MTRTSRATLLALGFLAVALSVAANGASGRSLDELRSAGAIGERYDGFVEVKGSSLSEPDRERVRQVNDRRREIYEKRAAQEGVPIDQVGRVYAKKVFDEAPPGTWFLGEDGRWLQKE